MKTMEGGFRKLNFKDYCQEQSGAAPNDGALWTAPVPGDWSIGLGAGSLPTTYKGQGYRHLLAATGAYSRKYTNTPGANDWWNTVQDSTHPRFQCVYDFAFRVNTAFVGDGVVFGYMIENTGSTFWTDTKGYRVRFDGTNVVIEKIDTANGINSWTMMEGATQALDLDPDTDYYVRVVYIPEDFSWFGKTQSRGGSHAIYVTDNFDRRGSGDIGQFLYVDVDTPLTGGNDTKLMVGGITTGCDAEFWGIIYSNGFIWKPSYCHYTASMGRIRQDCIVTYISQSQEQWDFLSCGDRVELWVNEQYRYRDPDTGAVTFYNKSECRFDGQVYRIEWNEKDRKAVVFALDEFTAGFMIQKGHHEIPSTDTDYLTHITGLLGEYQGEKAYPQRVAGVAAIDATVWNVAISATWNFRGRSENMWKLFTYIVNAWMYWDPVTAMLVSRRNPIATSRSIDLYNPPGELSRCVAVVPFDSKRDHWLTQVTEYHDNGAGSVTSTVVSSSTDKADYGSSEDSFVDIDLPPTEGGLVANNRFDQMNDKSRVVDSLHVVWGSDFGIGCKVDVNDPAHDIDSPDYTITEIEMYYSDEFRKKNLPASLMRLRLSPQVPVDGECERLPRCESSTPQLNVEDRKQGETVDHYWT